MKIKVNKEEMVVFFEVGFPTCLGVPQIMKKHFPDCSYQVLSHQQFQKLDFPIVQEVLKC